MTRPPGTSAKRRWAKRVFVVMLILLFGPYLVSRLASPLTVVSVHQTSTAERPRLQRPETLRIGTYNIAHGRGLAADNFSGGDRQERRERLRQIGRLLRELELDVVVLNEVDFRSAWSHHLNQAEIIAQEAGLAYRAEQRSFDAQLGWWSVKSGNAILSKYPISDSRLVDLPGFAAWETVLAGKKRALACTISLGETRQMKVLAVHLSHRSEAVRVASARVIAGLRDGSRLPLVCAGDFNSCPSGFPAHMVTNENENAMAVLLDGGQFQSRPSNSAAAGSFTFPANQPDQVIDWILFPPDWTITEYRVIDSILSDHCPVVAELNWPKENQAAKNKP